MTADQLIQETTNVLFVLIAVAATITAIRRPRPATIDAALLFGALGLAVAAGKVLSFFGLSQIPLITFLSSTLVMAMPYLLLRLLNDFARIPPWIMAAGLVGLLLSAVGLAVIPTPLPGWFTLALVGYFAAIELYATARFVIEARGNSGVSRQRMIAAAGGSLFLGLALATAAVVIAVPTVSPFTRIFALLSAISYAIAFSTPAVLRRAWLEPELRAFLQKTAEIPATAGVPAIRDELERAAGQLFGVERVGIGLWDEGADRLRFSNGRSRGIGEGLSGRVYESQLPMFIENIGQGVPTSAARLPRPQAVMLAPITAQGRRIGVLRFVPRTSLFAEDDLELMEVLGKQAALVLDHAMAYDELTEQSSRVQEATRLKSEFLANMSHELRTPLNGIIGFSELLHDGKAGPINERQATYAGHILTSGRHLMQLINDVLDLSKVEAGKLEFRPESIDPRNLVAEVTESLQSLSNEKTLAVETEIAPDLGPIVIDRGKLKQVLYNYVSNAIKFTPDGGTVRIAIRPQGAAEFRLEVADTGVGVAPEDLDRLFVEFQQLDAGIAKEHPGTGLGLALTKRIVEAQGGKVGVTSEKGKGSVFFAVLPRGAAVASQSAPMPSTKAPSAGHRPSVLVIEDNADDRALIVDALSTAGYATTQANTGKEALAMLRRHRFDLISLDMLLPDFLGIDLLRAIRNDDTANRDTPVLVVSVVAGKSIANGYQLVDYLVKPVTRDDLLASLERAGLLAHRDLPVLVVDDDPAALQYAEDILTAAGYRCSGYAEGEKALAGAATARPAAVVLDLIMPGLSGFEVLERLRAIPGCQEIPVIVWTGKDLTLAEHDFLRERAAAVLAKANGAPGDLLLQVRRSLGQ